MNDSEFMRVNCRHHQRLARRPAVPDSGVTNIGRGIFATFHRTDGRTLWLSRQAALLGLSCTETFRKSPAVALTRLLKKYCADGHERDSKREQGEGTLTCGTTSTVKQGVLGTPAGRFCWRQYFQQLRSLGLVCLTGASCSLSTLSPLWGDELNSSNISSGEVPQVLESATRPPVLLAPPGGAGGFGQKQSDAAAPGPVRVVNKLTSETGATRLQADAAVVSDLHKDQESAGFRSLLPAEGLGSWVVHEGRIEAWTREEDVITCRGLGGGWLRTEREYSDFHLMFEYRLQPGANSGVAVRCPSVGNPTFTGLEIQLLDDSAEKYENLRPDQYTGSVYYQVAPRTKPTLNPAGEWNQCEIICQGDEIQVRLNGKTVTQVNLAEHGKAAAASLPANVKTLADRPPTGFIALQSHPAQVDFRALKIRDLAVTTPSGLQIVELAIGEGEALTTSKQVLVHYVGQLQDGTRFGDTRDFGDPVAVSLDAVLPGWREGLVGMKVGGKRRLIVPPELGYGSKGVTNLIPPDARLIFEVELCGFER